MSIHSSTTDSDDGRKGEELTGNWADACTRLHHEVSQPFSDQGMAGPVLPPMATYLPSALLEGILGSIEGVVWSVAADTLETLYVSPFVERIYGRSATEFFADSHLWFDVIHPDDQPGVTSALQQLKQVGHQIFEYRILRPDGQVRWIQDRVHLTFNLTGRAVRIDGIATDITDRKQIEQERDAALKRLQIMLERIPLGCIMNEPDFRVSYWNGAAEKIFGYSAEDVIGKQPYDTFVPSFEKPYVESIQRRMLEGDMTAHGSNQNVTKDGRTIFCDWYNTPLMDDQGHFLGFLTLVQDVTERKQAEFSLRQQAERDRILTSITQQIRQSLNLDEILPAIVQETQQLLDADRVLIYRFNPDWSGDMVAEAVLPHWRSVLGQRVHDPCFKGQLLDHYRQGRVSQIEDLQRSNLTQCHRNLLNGFQVQANLVVPINCEGHLWGLLCVHQCRSSRHWHNWEVDLLQQLAIQAAIAIHQSQLYEQTRQQAERERLLSSISQHIRQSLDLNAILHATVTEVLAFLRCDRVIVLQVSEDQIGTVAAEALAEGCQPFNRKAYPISCQSNCEFKACQENPVVVDGMVMHSTANCPMVSCFNLQNHPHLLASILHQEKVWGLLIAEAQVSHQWESWEIDLVSEIASQVSVAILQAQLYQQIQKFNSQLEQQVEERTTKLQQSLEFEALLKRITDKVRDSLDKDQILQAAVQELAIGLNLVGCDSAVYSEENTVCTIVYEYTESLPAAVGLSFSTTNTPKIHQMILQGEVFQGCLTQLSRIRPEAQDCVVLACPLIDDQRVLGNLWLFKPREEIFNDLEVRLVQQVATQCAISLRQSRLYQIAQEQVQELERLNQLKDDFLSTVSHELRTPMSNIKMATQMLQILWQQQADPDPEAAVHPTYQNRMKQYFQILNNECQREISLINDLLDLSRLDAETEPLTLELIDLTTWIPTIATPFAEKMRNHNQQLTLMLPPGLPLLTTDIGYLERVLTELLQNACKYTPSGGTIAVQTELVSPPLERPERTANPPEALTPRVMQVRVSNSGVEIPPTELERIFDRFYRIPNNDPWKHGGTGLGLALVKKLVEQLRGTIEVSSSGGQTMFTLKLPLDLG